MQDRLLLQDGHGQPEHGGGEACEVLEPARQFVAPASTHNLELGVGPAFAHRPYALNPSRFGRNPAPTEAQVVSQSEAVTPALARPRRMDARADRRRPRKVVQAGPFHNLK